MHFLTFLSVLFLFGNLLSYGMLKAACAGTAERQNKAAIDAYTYHFPPNTALQMQKCIKSNNKMLIIPIVLPNWPTDNMSAVLETPVEIAYPFDKMPILSGYQYVVHEYTWSVGKKGLIVAFLLVESKGNIYYMDTPDAPFKEERDIIFYKASMSQEWKIDFLRCLDEQKWSGVSSIWQLPNGTATTYSWHNPDTAFTKLKKFCAYFPIASTEENGKWEQIVQPCFTPNVFCERHLHAMPSFSKATVLLLHSIIKIENIDDDLSFEETKLFFPNGKIIGNIVDMKHELDKLLLSRRYIILAYDRKIEKELEDPERDGPWAPYLRAYAADKGIPLVILYGEDKNAPEYEGLPKQIRQFWQCPQCITPPSRLNIRP